MTKTSYFEDIRPVVRVVLLAILALVVLALTACTTAPVVPVERHPPPADMIRLQPLPIQTDPTLGGLLNGYANAAQQYRDCTGRLGELQEWVKSLK